MKEEELKTSTGQRIVILLIAIIMLGTIIATYISIVLGNSNNSSSANTELDALYEKYLAARSQVDEAAEGLSATYFDTFAKYKSNVKAYNEGTANTNGLVVKDLAKGTGRELGEDDTDYYAYYIGWCADESVFESSFNDFSNPSALKEPLDASTGLIEGWELGVVGMKIGGVRELTIPGELAYGETSEICGGTNKPLKFIVMPIEVPTEFDDLVVARDEVYLDYYYLQNYGIKYSDLFTAEATE